MGGTLLQDIRLAIRILRTRPGFTLVSLLILGLGIGANTAIFSMVNTIILRQLPFSDAGKLVWIWSSRTDRDKAPFSIPDYIDHRDQNTTMEQLAAFTDWSANLTESGDPERLLGVRASADSFGLLGVSAFTGRTLTPEDDKPGAQHVVVLSNGLWLRRFGGDKSIVGRQVILNGEGYTVAGVMPPEFIFPGSKAEIIAPLSMDTDFRRQNRAANFLKVIGRMKPGATLQQAQPDQDSIARTLKQDYPTTHAAKQGVRLFRLQDEIVGNFWLGLALLLGAVALVLMIVCLNIANLSLARASSRRKEMAIRSALGASRGALVRQLLTESLILAIAGGLLGIALARLGIESLIALSPAGLPRAAEVGLDPSVLIFTLGLSIVTGVIFGFAPAVQGSRTDLNEDLKEGTRGSTVGSQVKHARGVLVVLEVAISLVLLVTAGLLIRSFIRLQSVRPGFDSDNLLVLQMSLPKSRYANRQAVTTFNDQLSLRLGALTGVQSAGGVSIVPMSDLILRPEFTIVGRPPVSRAETPLAQYRMASPEYLSTMGIPLLEGRGLSPLDTAATQPVVVINQTLARRYWPNESPLGSHLKIEGSDREAEVVGVAGDVKQYGLDGEPTFDIYAAMAQAPDGAVPFLTNNLFWVMRTDGDPLGLQSAVRDEVRNVDKDVPTSLRTMDQVMSALIAPRKFNLLLLEIFAAAALVLAAIGLYGLISNNVNQRKHEIGIRMALGARRSHAIRMIVSDGVRIILVGLAVGLLSAFILTSLIRTKLFDVGVRDPLTFVAAPILLFGVGLAASYLPALRASRVNPAAALRTE